MIYVLLGNGFDLAHGLETRYQDFIKYIASDERDSDDPYKEFLEKYELKQFSADCKKSFKSGRTGYSDFSQRLFAKGGNQLWSNIETDYFDTINKGAAGRVNESFEKLKLLLQYYLSVEESKIKEPLTGYKDFLSSPYVRLISFNYTKTAELYQPKENIYYLHGQLFDEDNPIIFGYSATNEAINELSQKGDPEYLWNLKKMCYHQTDVFHRLMKDSSPIKNPTDMDSISNELWICGHSCGVSDTLILKELIESKNINRVRIMYYDNRKNFRLNQISLYSILDPEILFDKLQPYNKHLRMPQFDDDIQDELISKSYAYLDEIHNNIEKYIDLNPGFNPSFVAL